jgi:hypothetical protein
VSTNCTYACSSSSSETAHVGAFTADVSRAHVQ